MLQDQVGLGPICELAHHSKLILEHKWEEGWVTISMLEEAT